MPKKISNLKKFNTDYHMQPHILAQKCGTRETWQKMLADPAILAEVLVINNQLATQERQAIASLTQIYMREKIKNRNGGRPKGSYDRQPRKQRMSRKKT